MGLHFLDYLERGLSLRQAAAAAGISEAEAYFELRRAKSVDTEVEIQRMALSTRMERALSTLDALLDSENEQVALGACRLIVGTLAKPARERKEIEDQGQTEDMWTHAAAGLVDRDNEPTLDDAMEGSLASDETVEPLDTSNDSGEPSDHSEVVKLLELFPSDTSAGALELAAADTAKRRQEDQRVRPSSHLRRVPCGDTGTDLTNDTPSLDSEDGQPTLFE